MTVQNITIGRRIASRRHLLGKEQTWLAQQLGVSARHVSRLETDRSRPSLDMAVKLADTLRTSLDWLICGVGPETWER
jgi:transcriptional regulator with XRE-family HTH domain